jgi:hypothetical protein
MKHLLRLATIAAVLVGFSGCASGGSTADQLSTGLMLAQTGYATYCAVEAKASFCTAANARKLADAAKAAQDAIDTYAAAEASGNATQALLSHAQALIADVAKVVADIKSKG